MEIATENKMKLTKEDIKKYGSLKEQNFIDKYNAELEGYWYCYNCQEEVDSSRVTFEETHDTCGNPVDWIEIGSKEDKMIENNLSPEDLYDDTRNDYL